MKLLILLPLFLAYVCHLGAKKNKKWGIDRFLDGMKWFLVGASFVIIFL